ncbi:MAG: KH domain-containing protein [Armatimonadetes bacterium]|nr:KH domain-containing protein [Armatimonadota bacterium]PIU64118.1 MAG: hypothetical protein COS85_13690 [Armatimonadetes bacterium CG07_land_8_20_14_0_80_59_28]PIX41423.1 MAG: hypothetical protein COZ56_12165 [Armatimonadetes bacterium CG_4_8_14_3_um_filter_58_9]PIY45658.1 MAG: hypothetical protein COZ05_06335 [Armatimonadetes bacterium CG_4_10_14_3_um_filter_59_10]PJB78681.1 MAG: hypothetical protein CO095_00255 [Armatimonadetes bacterium CG_4_9_14_3_um_filter_58_7]
MQSIEETAKTVDEAVARALEKLQVSREDAEVAILEVTNRSRLFGFLGQPSATVRVTVKRKKEKRPPVPERELIPEPSVGPEQPSTDETDPFEDDVVEVEVEADDAAEDERVYEDAEPEYSKVDDVESAPLTMGPPSEYAENACAFITDILSKMDVDASPEFRGEDERNVYIQLVGEDLGILIGKHGAHIDALQYLVNVILSKDPSLRKRVVLDGGGYRERREAALVDLARSTAARVKRTGASIRLAHLRADERRIVHMSLQDDHSVRTYSEGDEPDRGLVIASARKGEDQ